VSARLTFFGGKGGVGKTTCAAAAAVRAAREGRCVLVVSTDPAHSLGDALAMKLRAEPVRVAGTLFAAQLDADRALERWRGEREDAFRTIAERGTYLDEEDVEKILGLSIPGVDELVGLLELVRLSRGRDYDEVIVDTAPTGHTIRLLEMPDTLKRLGEVLDDMHAKHRFLASSIAGRYRADSADRVIAGIQEDAAELRRLLTSDEAGFTWVTLPEPLPIAESAEGIAAVEALGVRVRCVVVNRLWPAPDRACRLCTPRAAAEAESVARGARELAGKGRALLAIPARIVEPRGQAALAEVAASVRPLAVPRVRAAPRVHRSSVKGHARSIGTSGASLVLVGGKGGVGKTTVAAALALAETRRVLLLSTDPAHSLGDALGIELGDEPRRITKTLFAREMDAKQAFEKEKAHYRQAIDDLFAGIFKGSMDASFDRAVMQDLLELAPPGLDELFAVVSLVDALFPRKGKAAYDVVIVDTAPTGHTLRLLALPETALEWVHALMEVLLKYRRVVGLGEVASDLTALARRLRALLELLHDPKRCAFVAVTRPAELPRLETERLVARLAELGVPLAAIVANAATVETDCTRCSAAHAAEAPELRRLGRLAKRFAIAPATYPPPRGAAAIAAWHRTWRDRL
jgi:arsenite-transporting ATPase